MLTLVVTAILFLVWHIPFQWGIFYVVVDGFLRSIIIFSVITFLATVLHPFIAVLVMLVLCSSGVYHSSCFAAREDASAFPGRPNFVNLVKKVKPSVVNIRTEKIVKGDDRMSRYYFGPHGPSR